MRRIAGSLLALALLAGLTAGCGSDKDSATKDTTTTAAAGAKGEVKLTTTEYAFQSGTTTVSGGRVDLTLTNTGKEAHQAVAVKLAPGKTLADYAAFFANPATATGPPPGEVLAGVTGLAPGKSGKASFKADPGSYFWACFLPGPDGAPHLVKGMALPFTVAGDNGLALEKPADTVTAVNFGYQNV